MSFEIVGIVVDAAGKYRPRVMMADGSTCFLKFDIEPTQEDVDAVVCALLYAEAHPPIVEVDVDPE